MQERTRKRLLLLLGLLLAVLLAAWWYSGFSLDFMRFFAAEPAVKPGPTDPPPAGCHYEEVQCIQAPCDPVLVCPSCQPRPACLDANPSCDIAEPADGWCPPSTDRVQCDPITQTVKVGAAASLIGSSGGNTYEWFSPDGTPTTGTTVGGTGVGRTAPYTVTYSTPGTKKVTIQSTRRGDTSITDSVACTVIVTL